MDIFNLFNDAIKTLSVGPCYSTQLNFIVNRLMAQTIRALHDNKKGGSILRFSQPEFALSECFPVENRVATLNGHFLAPLSGPCHRL